MLSQHNLVQQSRQDIEKGSKSFSLASFFFSQKEKEASWKLYSWCRYCDDVIDHAENLAEAQLRVQDLISKTLACYAGNSPNEHPWTAFAQVIHQYQIPKQYPLDLLRGFQMDAAGVSIPDEETLLDYCYCVAGTVGLMMCHIMRVRSPLALDHAVALGRAMQLTNISRDIQEDFRNKRIYLPLTWLQAGNLTAANFFESSSRRQLQEVVGRLISKARELYQVGAKGLEYLPLRSAWAVCIAMNVYRDIGEQVSQNHAFDQRVIVSRPKKILLLLRASVSLIPLIFYRISHPFKAADQLGLWSES